MKRQFLSAWLLALANMLLIVPSTSADILVSHDGGTWQSTWTVNENGSPFWDHTSADGSQKNIGYYLSGTGAFTTQYLPYSGPGSHLPYLGIGTAADRDFFFQKNSSGSIAALKLEIAGNAGYNQFGWYDYDTQNNRVTHLIFDGSANSSSPPYTFTPQSTNYGFYFVGKSSASNVVGTWFTEGQGDHFAVFSAADSVFWIGMEDLNLANSDLDYNDMVIKVSSIPSVPEPHTMLLLGLGLAGLALAGRKFRHLAMIATRR